MADPLRSTSLPEILAQLGDIAISKYQLVETGSPNDWDFLYIPRKFIILPAHYYWMPETGRLTFSGLRNLLDSIRKTGELTFPLVAISGRGQREILAIGGAVSLNVNFRAYFLVGQPPAQDVVEKLAHSLSHLSRVFLAHFHNPPYWWFIQMNEEEVLTRFDVGLGVTAGFVGGVVRGMPHVFPAPPP